MKEVSIVWFVFFSFILKLSLLAQSPELKIEQLTDDFFVYTTYKKLDGYRFPSNSAYLLTEEGVVLMDTPWDTTQFQPLLDSIREKHGKKVVLCLTTHYHDDRTAGLEYYRKQGIPTYSSRQTLELCQKNDEKSAEYSFSRDTVFTVGTQKIQTYYPGAGHSPDNIVVWLEQDKILYGGCLIKSTESKGLGNTADANLKQWVLSIKELLKKYSNANYVIPGHFGWDSNSNHSLEHTLSLLNEQQTDKPEFKSFPVRSYAELKTMEASLPYIYEFDEGAKSILVYGSYHTNNAEDSIINHIEKHLIPFKADLILYEGDGIEFETNRTQSVETYFEMGLVRFLADSLGVPDLNLEPPAKDKYRFLLDQYPKEEVFLATVGKQITLLLISKQTEDFEAFYRQFVRDLKTEGFPIEEKQKEVGYFYELYQSFYQLPFDLNTFDYETVEIKFNKTKLNQINQEAARFRDSYMLSLIEEQLKYHDKIYVQVGGRHAMVWEPAIRAILKAYH